MGSNTRIGYGYDVHRLDRLSPNGSGRPFTLAGVAIDHTLGPVGNTDADVLLHAVIDAVLGAMAFGSMSTLFSADDPRRLAGDSSTFLREACRRVSEAGWQIGNVDATLVLQEPRIAQHLGAISAQLGKMLSLKSDQVNIKVKTHEGLDALGEGLGVEAHAVVLLFFKR